jgi:hypothetical protein
MQTHKQYVLMYELFNLFQDTSNIVDGEELFPGSEKQLEQVVQKNALLFLQLRTQSKAELNKRKHARVLNFLTELKEGIESNVESYKNLANEIFSKEKFAELQPMFRNLTNVSDKDKKSVLMDSKLLDLLSEIEEEYNKEK